MLLHEGRGLNIIPSIKGHTRSLVFVFHSFLDTYAAWACNNTCRTINWVSFTSPRCKVADSSCRVLFCERTITFAIYFPIARPSSGC